MRFRLTSFHKKSAFSATAHSENSESGRLSYFIQFFVWFHIVCDRYASDHAHFTFFNLIWPLSLSWVFEIQTNGYTEKLSYIISGGPKWKLLMFVLFRDYNNSKYIQTELSNQGKLITNLLFSDISINICLFGLFRIVTSASYKQNIERN